MSNQKKSGEFMTLAGQQVFDKPVDSASFHLKKLRLLLLIEEVLELAEASGLRIKTKNNEIINSTKELEIEEIGEFDIIEVADALGDILYVTYGAGNSYGIELQRVYDLIHASNLTKFIDGHRCLETGKWIKGPSYSPVDLAKEIKLQQSNTNDDERIETCLI